MSYTSLTKDKWKVIHQADSFHFEAQQFKFLPQTVSSRPVFNNCVGRTNSTIINVWHWIKTRASFHKPRDITMFTRVTSANMIWSYSASNKISCSAPGHMSLGCKVNGMSRYRIKLDSFISNSALSLFMTVNKAYLYVVDFFHDYTFNMTARDWIP